MAERGKIFKEAPIIAPKRSWFDMSFDHVLSMNMGDIVPVTCMECLPGDHLKVNAGSMARFAPMVAPALGKVNLFSYWFYVRDRDIWTDFDKFITNNDQRKTWQQQSTFVPPVMPKIKPLSILTDDDLNGDCVFSAQTEGTSSRYDSDYVRLVFNSGKTAERYYALVLYYWPHEGNAEGVSRSEHFGSIPVEPHIFTGDTLKSGFNTYGDCLVILFRPNKADYEGASLLTGAIFDRSHDESEPYDSIAINPFGRGQLFDYLGMSIDGFYQTQWQKYKDAFDYYWSWDIDLFMDPLDNGGFDLKTFVDTHFIGAVYCNLTGSGGDAESMHLGFLNVKGKSNMVDNYEHWATVSDSRANDVIATEERVDNCQISELPIRAYRFIYDEYFRDQNYIPVNENTDFSLSGLHSPKGVTSEHLYSWQRYLSLERKAWEHDPYTSALPGPQRGDAIRFLSDSSVFITPTDRTYTGVFEYLAAETSSGAVNTDFLALNGTTATNKNVVNLSVDLSAATIENFRWANAMQKYSEKKARTGGRYFEYLLGIWNKEVPDSKLNRPIYLDGSKSPVQISEVLQTSQSDIQTDQPLGQMAGRGISVGKDGYFEFDAPDYGFLVQVVAVVPRVSYQTGLNPMFTRMSYLDYPLPDFAQLGEEYVKQSEIYYSADKDEDDKPFGYQTRYYQWKYNRDRVSSELATNLDFWTFARKFDSAPVMGKKFIEVVPDYRQFAVTSRFFDHIYASFWNDIQVNRALPEFGVPTL